SSLKIRLRRRHRCPISRSLRLHWEYLPDLRAVTLRACRDRLLRSVAIPSFSVTSSIASRSSATWLALQHLRISVQRSIFAAKVISSFRANSWLINHSCRRLARFLQLLVRDSLRWCRSVSVHWHFVTIRPLRRDQGLVW